MADCMFKKAEKEGAYIAIRVYCPAGKPDTYKTLTAEFPKLFGIKPGDGIEVAGAFNIISFVETRFERWDNVNQ